MRILFDAVRTSVPLPAIFIDRDGVINRRRPGDYVLEWSQFIFMPGIRKALKHLAMLRAPMIVISNQAAVGKGLLDEATLEAITRQLQQSLAGCGVAFNAYYYCTHRADEGCECRKPSPGLLNQAAADFNIDLPRSIFIGDNETDVQAALKAGCSPVLFDSEYTYAPEGAVWMKDVSVARDANQLVELSTKCLRAATQVALPSNTL